MSGRTKKRGADRSPQNLSVMQPHLSTARILAAVLTEWKRLKGLQMERMEFPDFSAELDAKKLLTDGGIEYWQARDVQSILGYDTWQRFAEAIERARQACAGAGIDASNHFSDTANMMVAGKGAQIQRADYFKEQKNKAKQLKS